MDAKPIFKDMVYRELQVGHKVLQAYVQGNIGLMRVRTITKITEKGVYLDDSPQVIRYPNRLYLLGR